jgi:hypothetical protein
MCLMLTTIVFKSFTYPEGQFLRRFGNKGKGDGELVFPMGRHIILDCSLHFLCHT